MGEWVAYYQSIAILLEDLTKKGTDFVIYRRDNQVYEINVVCMVQANLQTGAGHADRLRPEHLDALPLSPGTLPCAADPLVLVLPDVPPNSQVQPAMAPVASNPLV